MKTLHLPVKITKNWLFFSVVFLKGRKQAAPPKKKIKKEKKKLMRSNICRTQSIEIQAKRPSSQPYLNKATPQSLQPHTLSCNRTSTRCSQKKRVINV